MRARQTGGTGRTIYLAGPDVFLPDARTIGAQKKRLCAQRGLVGLFPLDPDVAGPAEGLSRRIYDACVEGVRRCDAVVANLTPFRGLSADPGTAFELGFAAALGKPVFAYANTTAPLIDRIAAQIGLAGVDAESGLVMAADGMVAEDFGLLDNLMLVEALRAQGRDVVLRDVPPERALRDLAAFEICLDQAAAELKR